jgi:LacI family transcriptional regulator
VPDQTHVTLEEVARQAEVSLATASRVLNGAARVVGRDLSERVLAAAEKLSYTPNAHAQALARSSTSIVGLITHDVSDAYFSSIAAGVLQVANQHGLLVMISSTYHSPQRELAYVSMLRAQRARAILLAGSGFEDAAWARAMAAELRAFRATGGQVACISYHNLAVDAVLPENAEGAAAMARALLDLGHRRFAVVTGPAALTTVRHRLDGFKQALLDAGVGLNADHVLAGDFSRDGGYAAAIELIDRGLDVTAIFVLNDVMAIGVLSALRDRGVDVPAKVSVAGFDDIPIVRDLTPALTTVRLPMVQLGVLAMTLALRDRRRGRRQVHRVSAEVILRASTAPPR